MQSTYKKFNNTKYYCNRNYMYLQTLPANNYRELFQQINVNHQIVFYIPSKKIIGV